MRKLFLFWFVAAMPALAQAPQIPDSTEFRDTQTIINAALTTLQAHPFSEGAALPATCATGERYYQTSLGLLYRCTATNTWKPDRYLVASSAPASCLLNDVWLDTSTPTWRLCTSPGAPSG